MCQTACLLCTCDGMCNELNTCANQATVLIMQLLDNVRFDFIGKDPKPRPNREAGVKPAAHQLPPGASTSNLARDSEFQTPLLRMQVMAFTMPLHALPGSDVASAAAVSVFAAQRSAPGWSLLCCPS